jgi:hypothetical protein
VVSCLQIQTPAVKKVNRVASAIGVMAVTSARCGHALGWAGKPCIMNVASICASVPHGSERAVGMRGEASDSLAGEMLCSAREKAEKGGEQGVPLVSGSGRERVRHVVTRCGRGPLLGHDGYWLLGHAGVAGRQGTSQGSATCCY